MLADSSRLVPLESAAREMSLEPAQLQDLCRRHLFYWGMESGGQFFVFRDTIEKHNKGEIHPEWTP